MNKIKLTLLILIAQVAVNAQTFQGTIKPGSTSTSVVCALKSSGVFTERPTNVQFTIAIPQTVGARPAISVLSNTYGTYFSKIAIFESANYLTDYIYLVNMTEPNLSASRDYVAGVEDAVAEFAFTGNVGDIANIRLVQLPNGIATSGAGVENGNYNFYVEFANGEKTNTTAMFYTNTSGIVVNTPLGYSGYSSVSAGTNPLPLTWLNMSAQKQNGNALVKWTVANQVNSEYFEVMVSGDGRNFTTAGKVSATTQESYSFTDGNLTRLNSTYAYYRIKQVDKDGKFTYSEIKKLLVVGKDFTLNLVGNPIRGNVLNLGIQADSDNKGIIKIMDALGRQIHQQTITWTAGYSVKTINMPHLANGSYFIQLLDGKDQHQLKFVK